MLIAELIQIANAVLAGLAFLVALYLRKTMLEFQIELTEKVRSEFSPRGELTLLMANQDQRYLFISQKLRDLEDGMRTINAKIDVIYNRGSAR